MLAPADPPMLSFPLHSKFAMAAGLGDFSVCMEKVLDRFENLRQDNQWLITTGVTLHSEITANTFQFRKVTNLLRITGRTREMFRPFEFLLKNFF